MIDLEKNVGPFRIRAWGLIVNLIANAAALYGLTLVLRDGSGWPILLAGSAVTVLCMGVCAIPVRS